MEVPILACIIQVDILHLILLLLLRMDTARTVEDLLLLRIRSTDLP